MPKVTLEFNLPEEKSEYETTIQAGAMHSIIWDLDNHILRSAIKYESIDDPKLLELLNKDKEHTIEVLQAVRDILTKLVNEYDVKL
jgi:hypothetical protein